MKISAAPKKFEIFRSEIRLKMRQTPQAASLQCFIYLVRTCRSAAQVGRRPAGLIYAQSRTTSDVKFLRHRKKFEKFRSEIHRCLQRCVVVVVVVVATTTERFFVVADNEMLSLSLTDESVTTIQGTQNL